MNKFRPFSVRGYHFFGEVDPGPLPLYLSSEIRRSLNGAFAAMPHRELRDRLGAPSSVSVSVRFVSDVQMRALNRQYRAKDKTTDVLSFSQIEAKLPPSVNLAFTTLGDIVVSVPCLRRQSVEYGNGMRAELQRLLVHGALHLLGLNHERSAKEAKVMFAIQAKALRSLTRGSLR